MSKQLLAKQTASEEETLTNRGYKLIQKIGEGSYAKVYMGEFRPSSDQDITLKLACKIIDTGHSPKDFAKKFLPRELNILVKVNHPHIIHIHSIFQRRNKYYIFMRYAEKGDLLDFIIKNGAISENQARVWIRQISLAVQYLHEMEITHRDLKCENILVTSNYNVKLGDFGFARSVVDNKYRHILSETYCGSLSYAAPEILKGAPYNPKIADMWSLGICMYTMLNKAMPFDDTHVKALYESQLKKNWKFRTRINAILSEQVKVLIRSLLEPDIQKRYNVTQVVNSSWIGMDPRLKDRNQTLQIALNAYEFAALASAIDENKRSEIAASALAQRSPSKRSADNSMMSRRSQNTRLSRMEVNAQNENVNVLKEHNKLAAQFKSEFNKTLNVTVDTTLEAKKNLVQDGETEKLNVHK